jgi:hypothetical protein
MTTNLSGEYELDLTANDLITEALEVLQAAGSGEPENGGMYLKGRRSLNMMLKLWEAQGIHLWTYEEYTLFFQRGQRIYDLTQEATRCVDGEAWYSAQLTADVAALATSFPVDAITNMSIGQAIGVINTDNNIQWTVIERLDGLTVHLKDAIAVAATSGAYVRFYDTKELGTTTLDATEAIGQTILSVTSTAGMAADMPIGILQDGNVVHWTTINSFSADDGTVTVNLALTIQGTSGTAVVFYSSEQNYVPISRIPTTDSVRRHSGEASDYEIPIHLQSREDYMTLPNKLQQGTVIQAYFDRQEPQGQFYVWNAPGSAVEYLNFTAEREIQIIVNSDDTFDLPAEWYLAITYNLAKLLIPKIGCSPERATTIRQDATDFLDQVLSFDSDIYGMRLVPESDYG